MLKSREKSILENIIIHCNRIDEILKNLTYEEFLKDNIKQDAICFQILQIGELVKHFDNLFLITYPNQPWAKIKGMRDIVAHGYGTIKKEEVWKVVINQIKPLKEYCEEILGKED